MNENPPSESKYRDFIVDLNEHFIYEEYMGTSHFIMVFRPVHKDDIPER